MISLSELFPSNIISQTSTQRHLNISWSYTQTCTWIVPFLHYPQKAPKSWPEFLLCPSHLWTSDLLWLSLCYASPSTGLGSKYRHVCLQWSAGLAWEKTVNILKYCRTFQVKRSLKFMLWGSWNKWLCKLAHGQ